MSTIFVCKHHCFYGYQESEYSDVAFVTSDESRARAWCDSFRPVYECGDTAEWRSYTKMKMDKDYAEKVECGNTKYHVNLYETYAQS